MDLSRIDEVEELLEEIIEDMPPEIFKDLNGGIILEEEIKYHPEDVDHSLVVLGHYKIDKLGRQIAIYYGSFMHMYGYLPRELLKEKLRETLYHEFTHHVEFLAGNSDLVKEDIENIMRFKNE